MGQLNECYGKRPLKNSERVLKLRVLYRSNSIHSRWF